MTRMKPRLARFFFSAILAAWVAGCAQGPSGGVTVEGTLTGTNAKSAPAPPMTLALTHRHGASLRRVSEAPDPRIDDLTSMTLRVAALSGGPFRDTFVLVGVVGEAETGESDGAGIHHDGDDPEWARRRRGELALLSLPVGDRSEGKKTTRTFAPGSGLAVGSAWLVRLEANDPVIPWTMDEGDGRCRAVPLAASLVAPPAGQTRDCFDFATLAGMVLAHMAKTVTEALDDGPLPARVTAARHGISVIPALDAAGGAGGPGFALIYSAELEIGDRPAAGGATILVPVTILFRPTAASEGPRLEAVIAPLGTESWSAIGTGRVTLAHAPQAFGGGLAREVRTLIVDSLRSAALPPLTIDGADVPAGQALGQMAAAMAPPAEAGSAYPSSFGVIALPVNRSDATEGTVPTRVLSLPRLSSRIATGGPLRTSSPNQPGGLQAVAGRGGMVIVTTPLDPPGRIRRVTTLPPMRAGDPYELRILR